jgi:flagellar M-ring protein FliF
MFEWLQRQWETFQSRYWNRWSAAERAAAAAVATLLVILLISLPIASSFMAEDEEYEVLATNLSAPERQGIIGYLNRNGIEYRLTDNDTTILVPKAEIYTVRWALGSGVIPAGDQRGFKIFEEPKLGTTNQYFREQQIHAREVELERTIRAGSPIVENVFVHLNMPDQKLFKEDESPASATVKILSQGTMDPSRVQGIKTLVAYAIDGLEPGQVQVVDENMRILTGIEEQDPLSDLTELQLKQTREFERAREVKAMEVLDNVVSNASVKVTADLIFNHSDSTETTYDPETVVRSERLETEQTTEQPAAYVPGTAANVPGAAVPPGQRAVTVHESEKIETNNEVGSKVETRRRRDFELKRMTVAAVVDGATDNLEALAKLVKNAVGYDEARDGQEGFTIASIPFDTTEEEMRIAAEEEHRRSVLMMTMIYGGLVVVVFVGMLLSVYLMYRKRSREHQQMIDRELEMEREKEKIKTKQELSADELGIVEFGDISQMSEEDQRKVKLRQKVESFAQEKPTEFAQILRSWLNE